MLCLIYSEKNAKHYLLDEYNLSIDIQNVVFDESIGFAGQTKKA